MPTADSAPAHERSRLVSAVPSARLVTYIPAGTPHEGIGGLVNAVASVHPWEHPLIKLDRVSLWMP